MSGRGTSTCWLVAASVICGRGDVTGQVSFVDRAPDTGTDNVGFGRGSAMVDLDGDGLLDIIAVNAGMPSAFFRQRPDHTFTNASTEWGIAFDDRASFAVLAADFDNDGDSDVYFINGGSVAPQSNKLLRNDLAAIGVFTDISDGSGDAGMVSHNFGGTALDYNRDGRLDIFLTTFAADMPCVLLRNDGDLVFTDVSAPAGLVHQSSSRHCSSGDFNNDGWIDVGVGNAFGTNYLYRNEADGTFSQVATAAGVASPSLNFGLVLEDFDNDGWLDVYLPKLQQVPTSPSPLFRNNGDETFTDVTEGSGMTGQTDMGHNTGDLDADGYPDIFIGTGSPAVAVDDVLFLITPNGESGFAANDVSVASGITSNGPTRTHGIVIGDYDADGFVDVYVATGGPDTMPGTAQVNFLWRNQGNANQWTALRLTGTVSNRTAVGARCVAITDSGREIHRHLRVGSGFGNTDSAIQHFGIGSDQSVVRIEITWPSGITQTIENPPMQEIVDVVEPDCPADLDGDGNVGITDFLAVLAAWGTDPGGPPDLDGDGTVGIIDLLLLLAGWGSCP